MTTELQIAPTPVVVEDKLDEIPEMIAHIYLHSFLAPPPTMSLCGVHYTDDPHSMLHKRERLPSTDAVGGVRACGCGARACERCYELNNGGAP